MVDVLKEGLAVSSFPTEKDLIVELRDLASKSEAIALSLAAVESGIFEHPDGRHDDLRTVRLLPEQLGLLAYLLKNSVTGLSIEVGFGMGSSAATILGTRSIIGRPFEHIIFDPCGLPDERGKIVSEYLIREFGQKYARYWVKSQIGMAEMLDKRGGCIAGLIFIDGDHSFEAVMTDFYFADRLCAPGGHIVFDDAAFPAIETVIEYVAVNRDNYKVSRFPVGNTAVLTKVEHSNAPWDRFQPFKVPRRRDWTRASQNGARRNRL